MTLKQTCHACSGTGTKSRSDDHGPWYHCENCRGSGWVGVELVNDKRTRENLAQFVVSKLDLEELKGYAEMGIEFLAETDSNFFERLVKDYGYRPQD